MAASKPKGKKPAKKDDRLKKKMAENPDSCPFC